MCRACADDYANPLSRRFHAEAIACRQCGPRLSHEVAEIADVIADGKIVEHGGAANLFGPLLDIGAIRVVGHDEDE